MTQDPKGDARTDPPHGESIGRPGEWSEKRYEGPGKPDQPSVVRKPGEAVTPDAPVSTPVTQEDYKTPRPGS